MKAFEKIVKRDLMNVVLANLNPLQFAYRSCRGVDNALSTLLNMITSHLEGVKSYVHLFFIDFSSAFNCIQPHSLAPRLKSTFHIHLGLICWQLDFLTERSQRVKVNNMLSNVLLDFTRSCQGCFYLFFNSFWASLRVIISLSLLTTWLFYPYWGMMFLSMAQW